MRGRRERLSVLDFDDRAGAAVRVNGLGQQLLAQIDLRLGVVRSLALVLHHLEPQMIERAAHLVEPVLGPDDDLGEALRPRPGLLLLGQRSNESLPAPVAAGAADPRIEDAPAADTHEALRPV